MKERIEKTVDDVTEPEHGRKFARREDVSGDPAELRREQRTEMDHAVGGGPGLPTMTQGQAKGLLAGSLIGGAVGAVLFVPIAFIEFGDLAFGWRLLVVLLAGALGGGTAGAIYLMGRVPELEGETVDADGTPSAGSSPQDPHTDDRGRHHRDGPRPD